MTWRISRLWAIENRYISRLWAMVCAPKLHVTKLMRRLLNSRSGAGLGMPRLLHQNLDVTVLKHWNSLSMHTGKTLNLDSEILAQPGHAWCNQPNQPRARALRRCLYLSHDRNKGSLVPSDTSNRAFHLPICPSDCTIQAFSPSHHSLPHTRTHTHTHKCNTKG